MLANTTTPTPTDTTYIRTTAPEDLSPLEWQEANCIARYIQTFIYFHGNAPNLSAHSKVVRLSRFKRLIGAHSAENLSCVKHQKWTCRPLSNYPSLSPPAHPPERPKDATTARQPAPEILYLCTTCGATLRNNGEDGRWRRRRRPSSAPAAGRRRGGTGLFGGGGGVRDNSDKTLNWKGPAPVAAGGVPPQRLSSRRRSLRAYGEGRRAGGNASRLRYAHCARTIQHAYQDFRHRQYLRDWAFSLVREQNKMVLKMKPV